ncbi:hypothetical protein I203_100663 [Kwoniella mangroviensis CBS 8507]|uniref:uncharacterized protein n=1 Tax=Kwoniella mangroviensis CBS 8507 TaxID=1296122 RepID=UPI00080CDA81|nr:uncharacterized protein I203_06802 [Kwoniella mangroviensis CBS 8507]OCF64218.1 hypothetical protein I203_06802 [Kwoniella mangroviensis CBS 8507]
MDHGEQSTTADYQNYRRSPAIHADSTRPQQLAFTLLDDDPQSSFATDLVSASAAAIDKHTLHDELWTGHWDPRDSQPNGMHLPSVPLNSSFANGSEQFIGWTKTSPQSHDDFTAKDGLLLTSVTTIQSHTTSPSPSLLGSVRSSKVTKPKKGRNPVSLYCPFPSDKKDLQDSNRRRLRALTQKASLNVEERDELKRLKRERIIHYLVWHTASFWLDALT